MVEEVLGGGDMMKILMRNESSIAIIFHKLDLYSNTSNLSPSQRLLCTN